jgi:hypothetical protein
MTGVEVGLRGLAGLSVVVGLDVVERERHVLLGEALAVLRRELIEQALLGDVARDNFAMAWWGPNRPPLLRAVLSTRPTKSAPEYASKYS